MLQSMTARVVLHSEWRGREGEANACPVSSVLVLSARSTTFSGKGAETQLQLHLDRIGHTRREVEETFARICPPESRRMRPALRLSDAQHSYRARFTGEMNTMVNRRSGVGSFTGVAD
jgi:hypothetical protein